MISSLFCVTSPVSFIVNRSMTAPQCRRQSVSEVSAICAGRASSSGIRWALLGHEEKTVAEDYGAGFSVPQLKRWIDKIGF